MNLPTNFLNLLFQLFNLNLHTFFIMHNGSVYIYMTLCMFLHREKIKWLLKTNFFFYPHGVHRQRLDCNLCWNRKIQISFLDSCQNKPIIYVRELQKWRHKMDFRYSFAFHRCNRTLQKWKPYKTYMLHISYILLSRWNLFVLVAA